MDRLLPFKSTWLGALVAAVVGLTVSAACYSSVLAAERVNWKMQSSYPANLPALGETAKFFTTSLQEASGGELVIRYFEPGKLVPPSQIFDAVSAGTIEAGYASSTYFSGKIPALSLFTSVPFGPEPMSYMAWMYYGGGLELERELYAPHNIVPVPCGLLPPETSGWFREEIKSLEDLRGLKMRFSGLGGEVMKKLGVSVVQLAGGEIFPNLERGVIDATEFATPAIDRILGLHKIAQHYYFPGWHQPATLNELMVNKAEWDALSDDQRSMIEMACRSAIHWGFTKGLSEQSAAIREFQEKGVTVHQWSPAMIETFRKTTEEVMAEQSAADPDFKRVYGSLQAFRDDFALWNGLAWAR